MGAPLSLENQTFGKLHVIRKVSTNSSSSTWECNCDCGNPSFLARGTLLKSGRTDSCGCERSAKVSKSRTTHGMRNTKFYHVWTSMKQRCDNPKSTHAKYYSKRGITHCEEWNDFINFYNDMFDTFFEGAYIDRKDNNLGYTKDNCQWVTMLESNRHKTSTLTLEKVKAIRSSDKGRMELAKEFNVSYMTIKNIETFKTWKEI